MQHKITAPTWAEINLDNIKYNLKNIKKLLNEDTKVCAVLKANAYGHGAVKIAKLLENENVSHFAVARLEEAIELRENNITLPILCLGYIPDQSLELAIKNNVIITIYSLEMAEKLNNIAMRIKENVFVHIKIDTGMTRIGFQPTEDSIKDIKVINDLECINLEGIYTHFATADELDKNFTNIQVQRFNFVVDRLEQDGINIPIKHVSNSAATMDLPELKYDMVRCGIVLYGHYPSDDVLKERLQLKPVMTLKTTVAHIKDISPNVGVSYGLKYKSSNKEKIVTIPIGYADGFTRMQQNPKVSINGHYFDVVGRICMDQCMVKVDKDIEVNIGDQVILFGDDSRNAEDIANDLGTINYEVLCMISRRVDRVYMERNAIVQKDNYLVK
ncbi:Alanine racemase 1 [bioreactor metagenome]|uniref:Alanine racemase 1 n=1 Tax=bioreactor metagenome TaxID=1076179 RepID=A0A645CK06_9ZZZZ